MCFFFISLRGMACKLVRCRDVTLLPLFTAGMCSVPVIVVLVSIDFTNTDHKPSLSSYNAGILNVSFMLSADARIVVLLMLTIGLQITLVHITLTHFNHLL